MSVTTNIVTKFKQLFHAAGDNSNAVSDAVDQMTDFHLTVALPTGSDGNTTVTAADDSLQLISPVNGKLVGCNFATTPAVTNVAGDTITVNVTTNGAAAVNFDSDDLAANVAANGVITMSVNTVNSFVDAGEKVQVIYAMEDNTNNYLEGVLVLSFRRQ